MSPDIAVTHASLENWEYSEIIRKAADPKCSAHLENAIQTIDGILTYEGRFGVTLKRRLKGLFGVADLQHDDDFATLLRVCLSDQQLRLGVLITLRSIL